MNVINKFLIAVYLLTPVRLFTSIKSELNEKSGRVVQCFFGCLIFALVKSAAAFSQNTFPFKGKIVHNKKGVMKEFKVLVGSETSVTNDAGVFVIGLNKDITHVKVSLPDASFVVLYPTAGYVPIPRDLNDVPEIIIGSPEDNNFLKQYIAVYKEIKSNSSATAAELANLSRRLDSLSKLLLELNYTEADLRNAEEMQEGRDRYFPEISADLIEFVDKAYDLKTAFKYTSDYAFENASALQKLNDAITGYGIIRNKLSQQRFNYEKFISRYWQNDSITNHFHNVITYAMDSLHHGKILKLGDNINEIREYFTGGNKSAAMKLKIQNNINAAIPPLDPMLAELKNKTYNFLKEFSQ